jgi:tetraacyldisaccharide 4'-kinase
MNGWDKVWYPNAKPTLLHRVAAVPLLIPWAFYGVGVSAVNLLYNGGVLPSERFEGVRIVSVGNVTVGGAGKTPAVIYLAQRAISQGQKVAVLSRGYGRQHSDLRKFSGKEPLPSPAEVGDEPLLIAQRCPQATLYVCGDRIESARQAQQDGAQLLILDDGMQHRRLARDVDIVVIDEEVGFGNGRMLPLGPLRELPSALNRAGLIWVKAAEGAPRLDLQRFERPIVRAAYRPGALISPDGRQLGIEQLTKQPVLALAAIARPAKFTATLQRAGAQVVAERFFADHHPFSEAELRAALSEAERQGARVVTTEKDARRLPPGLPIWQLRLELEILEGEEHVAAALSNAPR